MPGSTSIERAQSNQDFYAEAHIAAMFFLWASRPRNAEPDECGAYFIGVIEEPRIVDQRFNRDTPYSICKGVRNDTY